MLILLHENPNVSVIHCGYTVLHSRSM